MKQYRITKVFECRAGIGAEFECDGKTEALKFLISVWSDEGLKKGIVVDERKMDGLRYLAEVSAATLRGQSMIASSDQSKKRLIMRLTAEGYSRDSAEDAAKIIAGSGLIDEDSQCERLCGEYVRYKNWGKKRVYAELIAKGYEKSAALYGISFISEENWNEALYRLVQSKYRAPAEDKKEQDKRVAALMRLGHSTGDIIRTLKEVFENE